ncbi:hypothetical protein P12x_002433 [Tundrisphaera lichenicola]|uniref:hypothetical protein n=1 Tax=Tundrisphaera lichenicola TaxID=2029860 RepID=UPI003EC09336
MSLSKIARPPRPSATHHEVDRPSEDYSATPGGTRLAASAVTELVSDTIQQAMASRMMHLALALAFLGLLACLSIGVEGPRQLLIDGEIELLDAQNRPIEAPGASLGRMTIGFGLASVGNFRDAESQVRFLQAILARWAAGVAGTLILLASTAGFLPDFLRPGVSTVLLTKPVPRWALLAGKSIGVLSFVAGLAGLFVLGTWLALGVRTGVWASGYLLAWPLLVTQFAGLYAASVVAATCTRNTAASLFAALACWMICLGVNGARETLLVPDGSPATSSIAMSAVEAAYWILPKPVDFSKALDRAVSASDHFSGSDGPPIGTFALAASVGTSLAFAVVMLGIGARQLETTDY